MKKNLSLRTVIIMALSVSVAMMLVLIYVFQSSYLDEFYRLNKVKMIRDTAHEIVNSTDSGDLVGLVEDLQLSNEVCVRIVSNTSDVLGESGGNACALRRLDREQIADIYRGTVDEGGEKLFDNYRFVLSPGQSNDIYVYSTLSRLGDSEILILVSSMITPLTATVDTLRSQYVYIAAIVIGMTVLLAFILSKVMIRPISLIRKNAEDLPSGNYSGNVSSVIKEVRELNDTLVAANDEINKADRAKKELLANVTHDLRTPLTMISGYGELIRDFPEENTRENISVIISEAERLSMLVNDLLDLSAMKDGRLSLKMSDIKVSSLIENVSHQYREYCRAKDIELIVDLRKDGSFRGDEARLMRVLYNFVSNAITHNDAEKKKITIGSEDVNGMCRIYVDDNGSGIAKEDVPKIYDRYYKVDSEHVRSEKGSGIGLSLSREILLAHGFEFGVDGEHYTRFYFDVML